MKYQLVKLSDCCEIISGSTPSRPVSEYWDGTIPWVTPKDLTDLDTPYIHNAPEKITKAGYDSCSTVLLPKNSVLLSSRAPIGHLAINTVEMCTNQGFKSLIPNKNVDSLYLFFCLKWMKGYLISLGTGSTFKEISKAILSKVEIPLPPLKEQKRIAAVLDKADRIRQLNRQLVAKYEALTQSVFLEMFGRKEHLNNVCLSEVCKINPKKSEINHINDNTFVSFIPMAAVSETGKINLSQFRPIGELKSGFTYFAENDILFAKITPCMENGKGAIAKNLLNEVGFGSTEFHVLRPTEKITSEWLYCLLALKCFRKEAEANMTGSAGQKRVPTSFLENYKVYVPSYKDQLKFTKIFQNIQNQKVKAEQGLKKSEELFNTLLQKAFRGELFEKEMEAVEADIQKPVSAKPLQLNLF